jgi:hypothetical protein
MKPSSAAGATKWRVICSNLIAGLERMLAACIACTQPRLADLVGNVEEMQLMRGAHRREHSRAHPRLAGVLKEIEHHRDAGLQQRTQMIGQHAAQRGCALQIVGNGMDFARVQRRQPRVFADQYVARLQRQLLRQGGFSGTDLAAQQVQGCAASAMKGRASAISLVDSIPGRALHATRLPGRLLGRDDRALPRLPVGNADNRRGDCAGHAASVERSLPAGNALRQCSARKVVLASMLGAIPAWNDHDAPLASMCPRPWPAACFDDIAGSTNHGTAHAQRRAAGRPWRLDVPADWNGDLVMLAHGYEPVGVPRTTPMAANDSTAALLGAGYAVAQSAYSSQGWAVADAITDMEHLRQHALGELKRVRHTWMLGFSMGGAVTIGSLERFPQHYAGGVSLCGANLSGEQIAPTC